MPAILPELLVADTAAWRSWLVENHDRADGVWLVLHRKGGAVTELAYEDAVQEALCFGWIDGQVASRDAGSSRQRMTPRRARSRWSARNVERVAALLADGRMHPAGLAQVEAARADGRWDAAYDGQASIEVPDDLLAAVGAEPRARARWGALTAGHRYAICYRLHHAKRAETRERQIAAFVADLAADRTPHPQRARPE